MLLPRLCISSKSSSKSDLCLLLFTCKELSQLWNTPIEKLFIDNSVSKIVPNEQNVPEDKVISSHFSGMKRTSLAGLFDGCSCTLSSNLFDISSEHCDLSLQLRNNSTDISGKVHKAFQDPSFNFKTTSSERKYSQSAHLRWESWAAVITLITVSWFWELLHTMRWHCKNIYIKLPHELLSPLHPSKCF